MGPAKLESIKHNLTIETKDLNEVQIRLLKRINTMLLHTLTTEDEAQYFEATAEVFKLVATAVKDADFCTEKVSHITYGTQALEYALDGLMDHINAKKIVGWDN